MPIKDVDPLQRVGERSDRAAGSPAAVQAPEDARVGPSPAAVGDVAAAFRRQAARAPDAVAVAFGGEQVSYAELLRRAEALARRLRRAGVGPEAAVAVFLDRSVELIVALLAVLEAGGAYVALDSGEPPERLALLLADAAPAAVVSRGALRRRLPPAGVPVLDAGTAGPAAARPVPARLSVAGGAGRLAYISFTSGSTGRPKGVAIPHRGVLRLVRGGYARFGPDQVFLQLAPVAFDASTFEIWGALLHGGAPRGGAARAAVERRNWAGWSRRAG